MAPVPPPKLNACVDEPAPIVTSPDVAPSPIDVTAVPALLLIVVLPVTFVVPEMATVDPWMAVVCPLLPSATALAADVPKSVDVVRSVENEFQLKPPEPLFFK